MKQLVTIDELALLADEARESIWAQAQRYGREPKIYLHWSAGHYDQCSDHYHVNISGDGDIYLMNPLDEVVQGTWKRNSGSVSITLCGCFGAGSNGLGDEPPTEVQINTMAQVIAAIAKGLWLTIDKTHVLTHGEAANNEDGYCDAHQPYAWWNDSYGDGNTRGDLEYLGTPESPSYNPWATDGTRGGDVLRGKANWYADIQNSKIGTPSPAPAENPDPKESNGMSKYFSKEEMMCHGAEQGDCSCGLESADNVSPRLLELLDQLRENIGGPLSVSCMFRCPAHNAAVGGVPNSQHALGTAADIQTPNFDHCNTPEQLRWYCQQLPFDGIGLYDWGCHVDVRDGGVNSGIEW